MIYSLILLKMCSDIFVDNSIVYIHAYFFFKLLLKCRYSSSKPFLLCIFVYVHFSIHFSSYCHHCSLDELIYLKVFPRHEKYTRTTLIVYRNWKLTEKSTSIHMPQDNCPNIRYYIFYLFIILRLLKWQ